MLALFEKGELPMVLDSQAVIARLGLAPHPEGGFYREIFRDSQQVRLADGRVRAASTSIYFLLPAGSFSAFHRVRAAEVWHLYQGGPLRLHVLGQGSVLLDADHPQAVVPASAWQAAAPESEAALCGCTVAPGFEFEDFEMGRREELLRQFPAEAEAIRRWCR